MLIEINNKNITLIANVENNVILECKSSHGLDFLDILSNEERQLILEKANIIKPTRTIFL